MRINSEEMEFDESTKVFYRGRLFTGEVVDTDDDGNVIGVTCYQGGVEHGLQYELFPGGAKKLEGSCDKGVPVGEWREWYSNGQLAEFNVFNKYGEPIRRKRWDENGNIVEDKTFRPRVSSVGPEE